MSRDKKFPSGSSYKNLQVRTDLYNVLKDLAKHRGENVQELLESFVEEVDEFELDEIGFVDFDSIRE